ncbi:DNA mismatch repair protein MutS [Bacillaceae bacterium Marseille-Q3522]|nr:DNA mismatch repair protein MutS [Bacillaceae bacterium Marseille-Q3522]
MREGAGFLSYFEDAIKASQELEITLTSRDGGTKEKIPMCGVPYHSATQYIETLIERGYKVAICEQTEDPKQAKGVVRREVVQLITPGTMMEGKGLHEKENNYLATINGFQDGTFGFACNDLSTGESKVTLLGGSFDQVLNELMLSGAKEVVLASSFSEELQQKIKEHSVMTISYEDDTNKKDSFSSLFQHFAEEKLVQTASRLFNYLYRTQKRSLDHLQPVQPYEIKQFMKMDYYSKRNLEITETIRTKGKKGSLLWLLDETKTAMGGRLLKQWLDRPLINGKEIEKRLSLVETLKNQYFERIDLRERLKEVYDLERLAGRVAFGNVNARDLLQLKRSLQQIPDMKAMIAHLPNNEAEKIALCLDPCEEITQLLEKAIVDNPPLSVKEGNIIRDGYHQELDTYRDASRNGKTWIAELEQLERKRTGIKSLKIGYNRIFGYYIEVTRANLHLLQEGQYERKQTLANAERFVTPELKEKETLILQAEEKSVELEYDLFLQVRENVKKYIPRLQRLAKMVSKLDVLQCFATISEERHYTRPQFSNDKKLFIKDGRHPVVEKVMNAQEYVSNDCYLDKEQNILLITGPNMSGKSTYMRQIALIAILAQTGCFVPAQEAVLPVFDQVFTRIGAADDLISGQSTFMVEMLEANNAITNATADSLILFDEIGRGTSTYDGIALAQAMIEYIHNEIGAKTLFSTHYHELTVLEEKLSGLVNIHVSAVEQNGKVVFLHKIKEGAADKSYGIHVAQLAELPDKVIKRARELLAYLEQNSEHTANHEKAPSENIKEVVKEETETAQLSFFPLEKDSYTKKVTFTNKEKQVVEKLKQMDVLDMTPIEALNMLYELHKKIR